MKTETQTVILAMEDIAILRLQEVIFRTGLRRSTLYDLIAKGEFPHPISISMRTVGWVEGEIIEWLMNRVSNHRKKSKGAAASNRSFDFDEADELGQE